MRLFIHIYIDQTANARWNGKLSFALPVTKGFKHGAVLSAIAYYFTVKIYSPTKAKRNRLFGSLRICGDDPPRVDNFKHYENNIKHVGWKPAEQESQDSEVCG